MKKYKIYHNPRCSKSRQTLSLLRENGIEPEVVEYLKTPLQKKELQMISNAVGLKPASFVRKNENDYKENGIAEYLDDDEKIFQYIVKYPKIMERPIVVSNGIGVIGRPPSNVLGLINQSDKK
tara:strand:- start:130 stop:498 length:369 start_codon:yes stop_codon:yes gene_type:complete